VEPVGPSELARIAETAARQTGEFLVTVQHSTLEPTAKTSGSDWASSADTRAETLIVRQVMSTRPDDGFLAEEQTNRASRSGVTWIIDPLDGTTNYLTGYPGWSVSIAAKLDDAVVAAVVHDPVAGLTYSAFSGSRARRNQEPIAVSRRDDHTSAVVGTGFSYDSGHRAAQAATLANLLPLVGDIRRSGSAALELCRVAEGSLDAFYEDDLEVWDWAAGGFIVEQAGGSIARIGRGRRSGIAAGPPRLLEVLLAHVTP
jgi:myo-inositol-1(or 4)-monophosphatase